MSAGRSVELARNLQSVRGRIERAAAAASRTADDITLVVVTKTWPATDVRLLAELGVRDVGENRDQEAAPKAAATADLALNWHFIGQLQTNKVRSVVSYAGLVESVDRPKLVGSLEREAQRVQRQIRCLVQVGLDAEPGRGGAAPSEVLPLAGLVAESKALELSGIMAVAPLDEEPLRAFERLAVIAEELRRDHPDAVIISAGMSADLEAAISCGATHVRIGSAVLGHRPPVG
ncbi:MAG TPA: YggS family pyridoxal phosphate-dependent enzyme [Actinomycetes bacterium]|nr:YggS family pyridoxal phosphate-dependent enzyme [Actinomycetes bacterium]